MVGWLVLPWFGIDNHCKQSICDKAVFRSGIFVGKMAKLFKTCGYMSKFDFADQASLPVHTTKQSSRNLAR